MHNRNKSIFVLLLIFFLGALFHRLHLPPFNLISKIFKNINDNQLAYKQTAEGLSKNIDKVIINWEMKEINNQINLYFSKNMSVEVDFTNKNLIINKKKINELAIIKPINKNMSTELVDWDIFFETDISIFKETFEPFYNEDNEYFRGCLTIKDINLNNVNIYTFNSNCEDAINLINVEGSLNRVYINNAISDGLDLDHSNISANEIIIQNVKSDCIDFGNGNYYFKSVYLFKCKNPLSLDSDTNAKFDKVENFREVQWDVYSKENFLKNPFKCSRNNGTKKCSPI